MSVESFWDATPRTINTAVSAYNERLLDQYDRAGWAAWHIAALPRQKRMPPLKAMAAKRQSRRQRLNAAETDAFLINLAKAQGGRIIYRES